MKLYRVMMKLFSNVVRECERRPFSVYWSTKIILEFRVFFVILGDFEVPTLMILTLIGGGSCLH